MRTRIDADRIRGYPRTNPRSSASAIRGHPRLQGQSTIEYAVVVAVVAAALVAMGGYVRRGISGKLRAAADSTGEQYDPRKTTGTITLKSMSNTTTNVETLNEPDLAKRLGPTGCCIDENPKDGICEKRPADLNNDGDCADERIFGTISEANLANETTRRSGSETVGPLGTDLWN